MVSVAVCGVTSGVNESEELAALRSAFFITTTITSLFVSAGCDRPSAPTQPAIPPPVLAEGAKKPNIIFLMIDTLRADRVGRYGHPGKLTATMDALAAEGVWFEHCQSAAPWTLPSIASMFTSYYPSVHKATDYKKVEGARKTGGDEVISVLSDEFDTLAEALAGHGYETAAVSLNPFILDRFGFGQGFAFFADGAPESGAVGTDANKAAFQWLDKSRDADKPFFLYLHYMDCHGPYDAPAKYVDPLMQAMEANPRKTELTPTQRGMLRDAPLPELRHYIRRKPPVGSDPSRYSRLQGYQEYWIAGYEAGVHEQDDCLADLIAGLKKRGVWDDALVLLVADHGEAFGEHDYWDHGSGLHQHQLSVPLIMRWPRVLPKNRKISGIARTVDIMPTLLEQLRIPFSAGQGASLVGAIVAGQVPDTHVVYSESTKVAGYRQDSILSGNWKLIRYQSPEVGPVTNEIVQLFDLAADPGEKNDVSKSKPEVVKTLIGRMNEQQTINANAKPGHQASFIKITQTQKAHLNIGGYGTGDEQKDSATQPATASAPSKDAPEKK
jgi:arylsulfatase